MRLTCGNLKGGVGKTTSAAFLACGLARTGRTLLVDADPYGSLVEWSGNEDSSSGRHARQFPATVIPWADKKLAQRVEGIASDFDHIVIDTGPNHEALLRQALMVSDVLVVPCGATLMDVERLGATFDLVDEIAPLHPVSARVLFTKTSERSIDLRQAREGLSANEFPMLAAQVRDLVHYSRARGTVPSELLDYDEVLTELLSLPVPERAA